MSDLLLLSLQAAVPLHVLELQQRPWDELAEKLPALSTLIASHGDNILYRGAKKGDTAKAFNALAEAVAVLSFVPGGVRFLGQIWDNTHPDVPKWLPLVVPYQGGT